MTKKLLSLLAFILALSLCLPILAYTPGEYEASAKGYNAEVVVKVTVDAERITKVEVIQHEETAGISDAALEKLPEEIVKEQSVALDVVSGATFTSQAILEAAKAALLSGGAKEEDITKAPEKALSDEPMVYEADVIIIGAGGAGMTAALEAVKNGASVIVLEKTGIMGGNTIVAGSALNGTDKPRQELLTMSESEMSKIEEALALEPKNDIMKGWQDEIRAALDAYSAQGATYLLDLPALHALQTYVGGDYVADPAVVDTFARGAELSSQYLEDLGTVWKEEITAAVGATWRRSHMPSAEPWGPKGASFILPQATKAIELGAQVVYEHKADTIIMEDGRAVGVSGLTSAGTPFTAKAASGVIITTGGFGANVEMRMKYNKHWAYLGPEVRTSNVATATGDGIVMAEAAGANLVGMEWIQMLTRADEQDFSASIDNLVFINKEGKRFVREDGRRDEIAGATLSQTDAKIIEITDSHEIERLGGKTYAGFDIEELSQKGIFVKANSVEELANAFGIDPVVLQQTIDTYNAAVEAGKDEEFGRQVFGNKLDKAPYYGFYAGAQVHHTMGGIQINSKAEVLGTDGQVIPGLYAAGEVTGGIHGANRLGGNAISDIVTFGRIAGQNASQK